MTAINCVIILVGLPACGKSTLAQIIRDHQYVVNRHPKIIELDEIFRSLPSKMEIEGKWHKTRDIALEQCTTMF